MVTRSSAPEVAQGPFLYGLCPATDATQNRNGHSSFGYSTLSVMSLSRNFFKALVSREKSSSR